MMQYFKSSIKIFLPLILILFLFSTSCNDDPVNPDNLLILEGTIENSSGEPVEGALIEVLNIDKKMVDSDVSKETGSFKLSRVPEKHDDMTLRITHNDYVPFEEPLTKSVEKVKNGKLPVILTKNDTCCGQITFIVKDSKTKDFLKDVEVRLNEGQTIVAKAKTDTSGKVVFNKICEGDYWFRIAKDGYKVKEDEIEFDKCDTLEFTIYLEEDEDTCCNRIEFEVRDKASNDLLKNVEIRLNKGNDIVKKGYTNADGELVFENVCDGEFWIRLAKDGYKVVEENIKIDGCDTLKLNLKLEALQKDSCCGMIVVKFFDKDTKEKLKNVEVKLTQNNVIVGKQLSNADGIVMFKEVCEGKFFLRFARDGYKVIEEDVYIEKCDTVFWEVGMQKNIQDSCCDGKIYVMPKDSKSGEKLNGAKVTLRKDGNLVGTKSVENGMALWEKLCQGKYEIAVTKDGYTGIEFSVELGCNKTLELVKEMVKISKDTCCGAIILKVHNKTNNEWLKEVEVRLTKDQVLIAKKYTNADGYLVFENVCEGKYWLRFYRSGFQVIEEDLTIVKCDTIEWKVGMQPEAKDTCCNGKIYIIPKDSKSGKVINGAKVIIYKDGNLLNKKYVENGFALFSELCEGDYFFDIIHGDYNDIEFKVELGCNKEREIVKELEPISKDTCETAVMKLIIKDLKTLLAIEGATVKIYRNQQLVEEGLSNADGIFMADGLLAPASYVVKVIKDGYIAKEFEWKFEKCQTYQETIKLEKK